jgi:trimeric autotransporter adhesin
VFRSYHRSSLLLTMALLFTVSRPCSSQERTPAREIDAGHAPSVGSFLLPDGRLDMTRVREAGFEGKLDARGFQIRTDGPTQGPVFVRTDVATSRRDDDDNWSGGFECPGVIGSGILAMLVFDGALIVGGSFIEIGGVSASSVARWDGSAWSPLGQGTDGFVMALTVYGDHLVAAGAFSMAGTVPAHSIAQWDGSAWSPLGEGLQGVGGTLIWALASYGGALIAGGRIDQTGLGVPTMNIARWNGSHWESLGQGVGGAEDEVRALTSYDGKLIVGGGFATAGGVDANCIATWNGLMWGALGPRLNGQVLALTVYNGDLIAGGMFTTAGTQPVGGVASWNGTTWTPLGIGVPEGYSVDSFIVWDGNLIAEGDFPSIGGEPAAGIAAWNGSTWAALGPSFNAGGGGSPSALAVYADAPMMATRIGYASLLVRWDGDAWQNGIGGNGLDDGPWAMTVYDNELVAGGDFLVAGVTYVNGLATWNGTSWSTLGTGLSNNAALALAVYRGDLIVGGMFAHAGGVSAWNIARWDGSAWSPLGPGVGSEGDAVYSLAIYSGHLIAGGRFGIAGGVNALNVASWDGQTWSPLASGLNDWALALTIFNGDLVAGGRFYSSGGVQMNRIARWDGTAWHPLGTGVSGTSTPLVRTLAVYGEQLVAAGYFTQAGGNSAANIARWNGSSWSALGSGLNDAVGCLALYNGNLIVGGSFTNAGGVPANYIARWDGSAWSALGSGLDGLVSALGTLGGDLFVGGDFSRAGGRPSSRIARWRDGTVGDVGSDAIPLSGTGTLAGDLSAYANDYDPTAGGCTGRSAEGNDIVYSFVLEAGGSVDISYVQPSGDASLYLVTDYNSLSTCVAGADSAGFGGLEHLRYSSPGYRTTLYLILDGHGAGGGPYSMTYFIAEFGPRPPGDLGQNAIVLTGTGIVNGDLSDYRNDYDPTTHGCTGRSAEGNDIVYSVTLGTCGRIDLSYVQPDADASVYVVTDYYDLATCVAGSDSAGVGGIEHLVYVNPSAPSTFYLILDGHGTGGGAFNLTYTVIEPGAPHWVGSLDTSGLAICDAARNGLVYMADRESGLEVIDVSDPANPQIAGVVDTPGLAFGVAVQGDLAYVADYYSLKVVSIADPHAPSIVGGVSTPGSAWRVAVSGHYAYVACQSAGLQVIDVSNPTSPQIVGSVATPDLALNVAVVGSYAYLADQTAGLQVVDVSNPLSPHIVGSVDTPGNAYGVAVLGRYAYVADYGGGLEVIDVSSPSAPHVVGRYDTAGEARCVMVTGTRAYVADGTAGLQWIDVTNPALPRLEGTLDTAGEAYGLSIVGECVYLADYGDGLQVAQVPYCPPPLPGDLGQSAIPLSGSGTINGDLSLYANDYDPGPQGCTGRSAEGNDMVYSIDAQDAQAIDIVCNQPTGDASIYLLSNYSDPASCIVGADSHGVGAEEHLSYLSPRIPETLYLVVDGHGVGGGAFSMTYSVVSASGIPSAVVDGHPRLAFPNPFGRGDPIRFVIPDKTRAVELSIYDVEGRRVTELVPDLAATGPQELRWDGIAASGSPVPSGVYFVRMQVGAQRLSKVLLLLR